MKSSSDTIWNRNRLGTQCLKELRHRVCRIYTIRYKEMTYLTSALDGGQRHAPAALPPGNTRYPLYRSLGEWDPGPVWTGAEILAHTGIRPPDRPARSESQC